jgi:hypothetical protein
MVRRRHHGQDLVGLSLSRGRSYGYNPHATALTGQQITSELAILPGYGMDGLRKGIAAPVFGPFPRAFVNDEKKHALTESNHGCAKQNALPRRKHGACFDVGMMFGKTIMRYPCPGRACLTRCSSSPACTSSGLARVSTTPRYSTMVHTPLGIEHAFTCASASMRLLCFQRTPRLRGLKATCPVRSDIHLTLAIGCGAVSAASNGQCFRRQHDELRLGAAASDIFRHQERARKTVHIQERQPSSFPKRRRGCDGRRRE